MQETEAVAKARILLVEDDPLQADAVKEGLQRTGYEVIWAQDGVRAIKGAKVLLPDIILLDVVLPGLDGHEVCRWLKSDEATKGIPIIMLTVKRELEDKISGLRTGADDYLPKPYNELELNARIYALLRTKALQDELRLKNSQLEELLSKVEYMAVTDALTGLYNRRRFHESLSNEIERTKRYHTPLSLVMIDIDHFKKVNDNFGHQAGDRVLMEVPGILSELVRGTDTAARYGGEEFVVILPNTTKADAVICTERIRKSIASHSFKDLGITITVSAGVAGMPDPNIDSEDKLIRCADLAMYRAKQNGRNRTEVAEGEDLDKDRSA
jgi:two-component system cell cycle response regulator